MTKVLNNVNKNKKKRGFTLVELLAVVAILAVVVTVVVVVATNVINNAREKTYTVTISNVEKAANGYVREYQNDMFWIGVDGDDNQIYQCISVQNLIDTGYFKNDLLNSKVSKDKTINGDDNIYVVMNNDTKTIEKTILLYDDELISNELCENTELDAYIDFDVPDGWAREKEVIITYKLSNTVGVTDGYQYSYFQDNDENILKEKTEFTNLIHVEKTLVNRNGYLNALVLDENDSTRVTRNYKIEGIDREGPIINTNYGGDNVVVGSITIPIKVTDVGIGFDNDSFIVSDLNISIGDNVVTDGIELKKIDDSNYDLKISNNNYDGELKIVIDDNKIFDKLDNGNEEVVLLSGILFENTFMISYDANGGSGAPESQVYTYDADGTINLSSVVPEKEGYRFLGWSTDSFSTTPTYVAGQEWSRSNRGNYVLYAVWREILTLYSYGTDNTTITGGWVEGKNTDQVGTAYFKSSFTKYSKYMSSWASTGWYTTSTGAYMPHWGRGNAWTNKIVDLTNYDTIEVVFTSSQEGDTNIVRPYLAISSSKTFSGKNGLSDYIQYSMFTESVSTETTKIMDISSIDGSYYVGFVLAHSTGIETWNTQTLNIYKVILY